MTGARSLVEQMLMMQREQRAVAVRLQGDRHLRFALGRRMPGPAEDEAAGGPHLAINGAGPVIFAVGGKAEAKAPADAHVDLCLQSLGPRIGPTEPADYFFRIGPGRVDRFGRRIDATLEGEAWSRDGFDGAGRCSHVSSSTKAVRRSRLSEQKAP